jgi:hypothetical protein
VTVDIGSILALAANAGFQGNDLATAVAIALAESGGNPSIIGDQTLAPTRGPSIGLWQINIGVAANPQYANVNLQDPETNANAAFDIYSRRGFRDWTTYGNGRYQAFLPQVLSAMQQASPAAPPITGPAPITIDAATGQVVDDSTAMDPNFYAAGMVPVSAPSSLGTYLLWAGLALAVLWIFEEAT